MKIKVIYLLEELQVELVELLKGIKYGLIILCLKIVTLLESKKMEML
jgi:hypothetical protein